MEDGVGAVGAGWSGVEVRRRGVRRCGVGVSGGCRGVGLPFRGDGAGLGERDAPGDCDGLDDGRDAAGFVGPVAVDGVAGSRVVGG